MYSIIVTYPLGLFQLNRLGKFSVGEYDKNRMIEAKVSVIKEPERSYLHEWIAGTSNSTFLGR